MSDRATKRCPRCNTVKDLENDFNKHRRRKDGHEGHCKICKNAAQRLTEQRHSDSRPPRAVLPPLESAYRRYDTEQQSRVKAQEHKALIEENRKLQAVIREQAALNRAPSIIVYKKAAWQRADAVACAIASDWHVEEPVLKAEVHGLNEYNLEISRSRAEHFFRNLLRLTDIMAKDTRITTIWLGLLGDFFSGWIHEELMANTLLAPGEAAHFVKGLLLSGIDFLLKNSSYIIEGDAIVGNHGRMTDKVHIGNPTGTSLEWLMYTSITDAYRDNPRVKIRVASQAMVYRRFFEKFNMRCIHGYEVKYGGGVGGLTVPLRKALAQWNNPIRADLTVMGHFHQLFDGGDFIVNGSLIGYNTFAQAIKASYEEPRQAFFLIHARKGGQKSITAPIWLDDVHPKK